MVFDVLACSHMNKSKNQFRIALIASSSHRRGPDSRLIRFVREFEHFLEDQELWGIKSTAYAIRRAGLLLDAELKELRAGREGGIVDITQMVVDDKLDVVIYLMDPRDPTSTYPESGALKRECVTKGKFFLSTYMSAVEWASLVWRPGDDRLLIAGECKADNPATQRIALIAHDERKVQMLKFALLDHIELINKFQDRIATGTTGSYLNGSRPLGTLEKEWKSKLAKARKARNQTEIDRLSKELVQLSEISRHRRKLKLKVTPKLSGPHGGDVQIAHDVLNDQVDKVIFFEDPYTSRPHEPDIQLLERTCRVRGERVVCLSDPTSANEWASAWKKDKKYVDYAPATVVRALEQEYAGNAQGQARKTPLRVVITPTNEKDLETTIGSICEAAASYVSSLIERLWLDKLPTLEPVRVVVPGGVTMDEFIGKLSHAEERARQFREQYGVAIQPKVEVMSMTGLIASEEPTLEANAIAERFARIFGEHGTHQSIPGAAFVKRTAKLPENVEHEVHRLSTSDIIILVGAPISRFKQNVGILGKAPIWPPIIEDAEKRGAVGDLSGLFIGPNGNSISLTRLQRVGLRLEDMKLVARKRNARVILIMGSNLDFLPFAEALLRGNQRHQYISTLVTDLRFARKLLKL